MYTIADYSLIDSSMMKMKDDLNLKSKASAFYYLVLEELFNMQEDEIDDAITDTTYLKEKSRSSGHDRGADVIYIDMSTSPTEINIFNFKYALSYNKAQNNFPSNEMDKLISFLNDLMTQKESSFNNSNASLKRKVKEIWSLYKSENPKINLFFASNHNKGIEKSELDRLKSSLKGLKVSVEEIISVNLVDKICSKDKEVINANFRTVGNEFFPKASAGLKSLICTIEARDLVRMVIDNSEYRLNADFSDFNSLRDYEVQEDVFEDNVRIYLAQRNKINSKIKETSISDDRGKFFYYNNGITMTCQSLNYDERTSTIVELEDIQVVNGSQTIHSLVDAMKEDKHYLNNVNLLVRIYETKKSDLVNRIAEYTNSQTEVKNRDIRSISAGQIKLEKEFLAKGYYYERKKNMYKSKQKSKRIDLEKVGQVLLAFYEEMPLEAKNKKSIIFAEKYDSVFCSEINYNYIMLPYLCYIEVEKQREIWKKDDGNINGENGHLSYSTYVILYILKRLAILDNIELKLENLTQILSYYDRSVELITEIVKDEKIRTGENFSIYNFLKSKRVVLMIEVML